MHKLCSLRAHPSLSIIRKLHGVYNARANRENGMLRLNTGNAYEEHALNYILSEFSMVSVMPVLTRSTNVLRSSTSMLILITTISEGMIFQH